MKMLTLDAMMKRGIQISTEQAERNWELLENFELEDLAIRRLRQSLNSLEMEVASLWYKGYTQVEIGQQVHRTQQRISQILQEITAKFIDIKLDS